MVSGLEFSAITEAAQRIRSHVHRTPVLTSKAIDGMCGATLFFKCENLQKAGAFKARGACNAVFSLSEEEAGRGVLTHSSGNHAGALAMAAQKRGIKSYIVMPNNAPAVKQAAVEGYGGEIHFCEPNLTARESLTDKIAEQTGATLIHPYNDLRVMAGQGTAALELLEQVQDLDMVLTPVGGGGLLSGTAAVVNRLSTKTKVIGAEPQGADDAFRSFRAGKIIPMEEPNTIADGLLTSLGDLTFEVISKYVHDIVTVSDKAIIAAMRNVWERMKIIIEPSSAVPVAALMDKKLNISGKRIGVVLSGGNVDLNRLPWS
ncbi:MAG TPA: pyridoxal-phosphate dependent enzyme [Deltaproteobacteria bacterium]|nr:pyridoxal-phosphate dependent enzyme [Deltaproteobacteria bacterium]